MNVAILCPTYGPAYRKHERCLAALQRRTGWPILVRDDNPSIHIARAILVEAAIEHGFDMTLSIDSDMTFTEEACETLVDEAWRRNAIVGGLYLGKEFGAAVQARFFIETTLIEAYAAGSVIEIADIGFGVTAVPTKIFKEVRDKLRMKPLKIRFDEDRAYTPWFSTDLEGEYFHSADFAFTERARRAGYKVFADTRHRFGHLGTHEFVLEDALPLPRAESLRIPIVAPPKG